MKDYQHISHLFTMAPLASGEIKNARTPRDCGYIADAAVRVDADGVVCWVGESRHLPPPSSSSSSAAALGGAKIIDCAGETWLPGLVDAHTHMVFGGHRAAEMMRKREGASYLEIAKAGGGIQATVAMTREAGRERLLDAARGRIEYAIAQGVRHVEIKSGYGLSLEDELMMLAVIQDLKKAYRGRIGVSVTCMGAHAFPPDKPRAAYLDMLVGELIPEVARRGLADACDVFIEDQFFTLEEGRAVLEAAARHKLRIKAHVDEITPMGGAALAASMGALSVEHCIRITDKGIRALADSDTTCVLLPMTSIVLRAGFAPARAMIDAGARVAIATDFNPGSSPCQNLMLAAQMGMIHYGLNPYETLGAVTYNAARALGQTAALGHVAEGMPAVVTRFKYADWQELLYWIGQPHPVVAAEEMCL